MRPVNLFLIKIYYIEYHNTKKIYFKEIMGTTLFHQDPLVNQTRNILQKKFPEAKSIQLKPGCQYQSPLRNSKTYTVKGSVRITHCMPELNTRGIASVKANLSLNEQVIEYFKKGKILKAIAIIGKIPSPDRRDPLYAQVAKHYFKKANVKKAVGIIEQIRSSKLSDPLYKQAAKICLEKKCVANANEYIGRIRYLITQYKLYKKVCFSYIEAQQIKKSVQLLEDKLNTKLLDEKIQSAEKNKQKNLCEILNYQLKVLHRIRSKIFDKITASYSKQIEDDKTIQKNSNSGKKH